MLREVIDFLIHMPANTVIFITMAILGLAAMLIVLRRLIEGGVIHQSETGSPQRMGRRSS